MRYCKLTIVAISALLTVVNAFAQDNKKYYAVYVERVSFNTKKEGSLPFGLGCNDLFRHNARVEISYDGESFPENYRMQIDGNSHQHAYMEDKKPKLARVYMEVGEYTGDMTAKTSESYTLSHSPTTIALYEKDWSFTCKRELWVSYKVAVDGPVDVTCAGSSTLSAEDKLTLQIGSFYDKGFYDRQQSAPQLQVSSDGGTTWHSLRTVKPNERVSLPYSDIAPYGEAMAWLGKRLMFRVEKKLFNGNNTYGNVAGGIIFYPRGMKFTIRNVNTRACDDTVDIRVTLQTPEYRGGMAWDSARDEDNFYWAVRKGDMGPIFRCSMQYVKDNEYRLAVVQSHADRQSPFQHDFTAGSDATWTLQLIDKQTPSAYAYTADFTIPRKPRPITVSQMSPQYEVKGKKYHVPSVNKLFATLSITDSDYTSHHRVPYTIREVGNDAALASIPAIGAATYESLSEAKKRELDSSFNVWYRADSLSLKPARDKYMANHELLELLPYEVGHIAMPKGGSYFLFTKNEGGVYNMYMASLNMQDGVTSIRQITKGHSVGRMEITPDGSYCLYKWYEGDGLYRVALQEGMSPTVGTLLSGKANNAWYDASKYRDKGLEYPRGIYYNTKRNRYEYLSEYFDRLYSIAVESGEATEVAKYPLFSDGRGFTVSLGGGGGQRNYEVKKYDFSNGASASFYKRCSYTEVKNKIVSSCAKPTDRDYEYYNCTQNCSWRESQLCRVPASHEAPDELLPDPPTNNRPGAGGHTQLPQMTYCCDQATASYAYYSCRNNNNVTGVSLLEVSPNGEHVFVREETSAGTSLSAISGSSTIAINTQGKGDFIRAGNNKVYCYSYEGATYCKSNLGGKLLIPIVNPFKLIGGGITFPPLVDNPNPTVDLSIVGYTATNICFSEKDDYLLFIDKDTRKVYRQYLNKGLLRKELEPAFKDSQKKQWIAQQEGTRVFNEKIKPNEYAAKWVLQDADGCTYGPFDVKVTAPPSAYFDTVVTKLPGNSCAANGEAKITYKGGGEPPFTHEVGRMENIGDGIVVKNLRYGANEVVLRDGNGNESQHIFIEAGNIGITDVNPSPQTCSTPNGTLEVNTQGISGTLTYYLEQQVGSSYLEVQKVPTNSTTYTFTGLSAGAYRVRVSTSDGCSFGTSESEYSIGQKIFAIQSITPQHVATFNSSGSVQLAFANAADGATCTVDDIKYNIIDGIVAANSLLPKEYRIRATSGGCAIDTSVYIDMPSFEGDMLMEYVGDSCTISTSDNMRYNELFKPYSFRVVNESGTIFYEGKAPKLTLRAEDSYKLCAYSPQEDVVLYSFSLPLAPIAVNAQTTPPTCPDGMGSVQLTVQSAPWSHKDSVEVSSNLLDYTTERTFSLSPSSYTILLRDSKTEPASVGKLSITELYTQQLPLTVPNAAPVSANIGNRHPLCFGMSNGKIWLNNLSGGSGSYRYRLCDSSDNCTWRSVSDTALNLPPDKYRVYLQDAVHGCDEVYLGLVTLYQPTPLRIDSLLVRQPSCELPNGRLEARLNGGSGAYKLEWYKDGELLRTDDYRTSAELLPLESLPHGSYSLKVTDGNGCGAVQNVSLREYVNPELAAYTLSATDATCYRYADGSVAALVAATTSSLDSAVLRHLYLSRSYTSRTSSIGFSGLDTGRYALYLYDVLGCRSDQAYSVQVAEPQALRLRIDSVYPAIGKGTATGSIAFTVLGGNDVMKNSCLHGVGNSSTECLSAQNEVAARFMGLTAGKYSLTAQDSKGCSDTVHGLSVVEPAEKLGFTVVEKKDALCKATSTGSITVQAHGGWGGYEYSISSKAYAAQNTFEELSAGDHIVSVRDRLGATFSETVSLGEPARLLVDTLIARLPTCELANGRLEAQVSGGTGLYKMEWNKNSAPYHTEGYREPSALLPLDNLLHGIYQLKVTDGNGCEADKSVSLREYVNPKLVESTLAETNVSCYRYADGSVATHAAITTSSLDSAVLQHLHLPQRYTSRTSDINFSGLDTGRYELYLYDALGCRSDQAYQVQIAEPQALRLRVDSVYPAIGKGSATGHVAFTVRGGNDVLKNICLYDSSNQPIRCLSERNELVARFKHLTADSYSIAVQDSKGCCDTVREVNVVEPEEPLHFIVTEKRDALCKAQTGSITVEAHGGWGGYGYKRMANAAYSVQNTFEKLYAGSYIISVQDRLGTTFSDTVVVHEPKDSLMAQVVSLAPPICGSSGSVLMAVGGGSAPYRLFEGSDTSHIAMPQRVLRSGLASGAHLFHLVDTNGCRFDLETQLPDTASLRIADFSITYPSAAGMADGAVEVLVAGGSTPYSYSFNFNENAVYTGSAKAENLASGMYTVEVSEASGCTASSQVYLPNATDASLEVLQLGDETFLGAADGYAVLRSAIGELKEVALFSPQGSKKLYNADKLKCHATADTICLRNLSGGEWLVEGYGEQGAKAVGRFDVKPYPIFRVANVQVSHVSKPEQTTGSIRVEVEGGGGGNTFTWKNAVDEVLPSADDEQATSVGNLHAGIYSVQIADRYGNVLQQTLEVREPAQALTLAVGEHFNETCKGYEDAYVRLVATGGWGEYQFRHDTEKHFSNALHFDNLSVRLHRFYLTDRYGVVDSVEVNITEPDYLRAKVAATDSVSCWGLSNGSITFAPVGGTAPYRLRERDVAPTWTSGVLAENLPEGYHTFVFTDSNSCVSPDTLTVYVPQPDSLHPAAVQVRHTLCDTDNGAMQVAMRGGTRPYRYAWTDFYGQHVGADSATDGLHRNGLYTLHVTDYHGCAYALTQRINASSNPRVDVVATTPVLCYGDATGIARAAEVVPATPYAPFSFAWSNSDTGVVTNRYSYGTHHVIITDTNGCTTTTFFSVSQPDSLRISLVGSKEPRCYSLSDAYLHTLPLGGVGGYRYLWTTGDTTPHLDSVPMGAYTLTLTDANGCTTSTLFDIPQPDSLHITLVDSREPSCYGYSDAHLYTAPQGGVGGYAYRWTTGDSTPHLNGIPVGVYALTLTDANGCTTSTLFDMPQPDSLRIALVDSKEPRCFGHSDAYLHTQPLGGVGGYRYLWTTGDTTPHLDSVPVGKYKLTLRDANGCTSVDFFDVSQPDSLRIALVGSKEPHCYGYFDAHLYTEPLGGVGGYRFLWNTGDTTPRLDSLPFGEYALMLRDANGCVSRRSYGVGQPAKLTVDVGPDITLCPNNSYTLDGQAYTAHRWYTDSAEVAHERYYTVQTSDTYYLQTTDERGCHAYDTISVSVGNSTLQADFLLSSNAVLGDTLILFELSNLQLDSLRWQYSTAAFADVSSNEHKSLEYVLLLLPQAAGEHTVGLYAYSGSCFSYISKKVAVQEAEADEPDVNTLGYREPLITAFKVYPNPSTGEFSAEVLLREPADIRLSLFSLNSSARLNDRRASGLAAYNVEFRVGDLPPGVYILLLTAGGEHRQLKIMKN